MRTVYRLPTDTNCHPVALIKAGWSYTAVSEHCKIPRATLQRRVLDTPPAEYRTQQLQAPIPPTPASRLRKPARAARPLPDPLLANIFAFVAQAACRHSDKRPLANNLALALFPKSSSQQIATATHLPIQLVRRRIRAAKQARANFLQEATP